MNLLKDTTLRLLENKRHFNTNEELLSIINKRLSKFVSPLKIPFNIRGYSFDANYSAGNKTYAISVIQKYNNEEAKGEVAFAISQMEQAEQKGIIDGGLVIYISNNLSEWVNDCLALDNPSNYCGNDIHLNKYYCYDWDFPRDYKTTERRYALYFTKGAEVLEW